MTQHTTPAIDTLLAERRDLILGRRVGLLCHHASVDRRLHHTSDRLVKAGVELCALFGPEHGVAGTAQDMAGVAGNRCERLGIRVHSLYGDSAASLQPQPEWLQGLDVLVVDLQDVGSRYYTYVWTMLLTMRCCAQQGVAMVVLDRPNPLGGQRVEGPCIEAGAESFVGLHSVPVRHGMTVGELARLLVAECHMDLDLTVVPLRGWQRRMHFDETGLPWVQPSPNMPTLDTALVYPGACLLEATNVSEGRGTTRPFETLGAPWIDGHRLADTMHAMDLPGLRCRPVGFKPTFQKFGGHDCGGIQLHVTDRRSFRPFLTGVAILTTLCGLWPESFGWRAEPYEFVSDRQAVDLLAGGSWLRERIDEPFDPRAQIDSWVNDEQEFERRRAPHLLYD